MLQKEKRGIEMRNTSRIVVDEPVVSRTYFLKGTNEVEKDEKLSQKEQKLIEVFRELKLVEQDMFLRQIIGFRMTSEQ